MKRFFPFALIIFIIICANPAFPIAPALPGAQVPQSVIDIYHQNPGRFVPGPALHHTMARYAEAKRQAWQYGLDDVDDIYGYFPVLCGQYSDSPAQLPWPIGDMQRMLFDGPWPSGTMADYYHEISYNQFHLNGTTMGWYRSGLTRAYVVGSSRGLGPDAHVGDFIADLVQSADPAVDFGQFDNDGPDNVPNSGDDDGIVDALFVVHEGPGGETGANNIWSHSWNLYYYFGRQYLYTNDPAAGGGTIGIGPYIIQPAVNSGGAMIEIGVFCHEFGHALGLPDLYDTDYSSEGIGVWGLMGSGSYNTSAQPSHMISWCRAQLGWIIPMEVTAYYHNLPISDIETSGETYKLWTNGFYSRQYFMVENRQRHGFDSHLLNEGLMIYHVDLDGEQWNEDHPLVDVEEADGLDNLHYALNRGDAGDIYPGVTDNRWFDEYTYPDSRSYTSQLTQVAVWNISDPGDTMYVNLDVIYSQPRLVLADFTVDDQSGNNDGRADPGETVDFWLTLDNLWASAALLQGYLSTDAAFIDISDSSAFFGTVASHSSGNNQGNPFRFSVAPSAFSGQRVDFNLHLEADGGYSADIRFEVLTGRPPVLLIDDDLGQNYERFLVSSLDEADYLYEVWDVAAGVSPDEDIMLYNTVIWMTGDDSTSTLTNIDIYHLQRFIDAGGSLLLTGQNINEDIGSTSFFTDYLKCAPRSDRVGVLILSGVPGNPISGSLSLLLVGGTGAGNQTSASSVYPQGIAEPMFTYNNGEVAGINYFDPVSGAHVVYFAFGLEAASGMASTSTRAEALEAFFQWAGTPTAVESVPSAQFPGDFNLSPAYPNPFNQSTIIAFSLDRALPVRIAVYDIAGRRVETLMNEKKAAGRYSIRWDASGLPSGVYLIRLQTPERSAAVKTVLVK